MADDEEIRNHARRFLDRKIHIAKRALKRLRKILGPDWQDTSKHDKRHLAMINYYNHGGGSYAASRKRLSGGSWTTIHRAPLSQAERAAFNKVSKDARNKAIDGVANTITLVEEQKNQDRDNPASQGAAMAERFDAFGVDRGPDGRMKESTYNAIQKTFDGLTQTQTIADVAKVSTVAMTSPRIASMMGPRIFRSSMKILGSIGKLAGPIGWALTAVNAVVGICELASGQIDGVQFLAALDPTGITGVLLDVFGYKSERQKQQEAAQAAAAAAAAAHQAVLEDDMAFYEHSTACIDVVRNRNERYSTTLFEIIQNAYGDIFLWFENHDQDNEKARVILDYMHAKVMAYVDSKVQLFSPENFNPDWFPFHAIGQTDNLQELPFLFKDGKVGKLLEVEEYLDANGKLIQEDKLSSRLSYAWPYGGLYDQTGQLKNFFETFSPGQTRYYFKSSDEMHEQDRTVPRYSFWNNLLVSENGKPATDKAVTAYKLILFPFIKHHKEYTNQIPYDGYFYPYTHSHEIPLYADDPEVAVHRNESVFAAPQDEEESGTQTQQRGAPMNSRTAALVLGDRHEIISSYNDGSAVYFRTDYLQHGGISDYGLGEWRCGRASIHKINEQEQYSVDAEGEENFTNLQISTTLPNPIGPTMKCNDGSNAFTDYHVIFEGNGPITNLDRWNPNDDLLIGDFPWQSGKSKVMQGFGFDTTATKQFADAYKGQTIAYYNQLTDAIQNGTYDTFAFEDPFIYTTPQLGPQGGFIVGDLKDSDLDVSGGSYWLRHVFTPDEVDQIVQVIEQDYNDGLIDITGPDYILYSPQSQKYLWPAMAQVRASQHIANNDNSDLVIPRNLIDRLQTVDAQNAAADAASSAGANYATQQTLEGDMTDASGNPIDAFNVESSQYLQELEEECKEADTETAAIAEDEAAPDAAGYGAKAIKIPMRAGETYQHYMQRMQDLNFTEQQALDRIHSIELDALFNRHGYSVAQVNNWSDAQRQAAIDYWDSAEYQEGGPEFNIEDYDADGNLLNQGDNEGNVDENGNPVDENGNLIDENGNPADENNEPVSVQKSLHAPSHQIARPIHVNKVFREGLDRANFVPKPLQHFEPSHSATHGHNGKRKLYFHKKHAKRIVAEIKHHHHVLKNHHKHFRTHHPDYFRGEGKKHRESAELRIFHDLVHPLHADKRFEGQSFANAINNAVQEEVISHEDVRNILRVRHKKYNEHTKQNISFGDYFEDELDSGFHFSWLIPRLHELGLYPIDHTHRHRIPVQSLRKGNWVICGHYDDEPHAIAIHKGVVIESRKDKGAPYMITNAEKWPKGFEPVHYISLRDTFPKRPDEITHDEEHFLEEPSSGLEGRGAPRYYIRTVRTKRSHYPHTRRLTLPSSSSDAMNTYYDKLTGGATLWERGMAGRLREEYRGRNVPAHFQVKNIINETLHDKSDAPLEKIRPGLDALLQYVTNNPGDVGMDYAPRRADDPQRWSHPPRERPYPEEMLRPGGVRAGTYQAIDTVAGNISKRHGERWPARPPAAADSDLLPPSPMSSPAVVPMSSPAVVSDENATPAPGPPVLEEGQIAGQGKPLQGGVRPYELDVDDAELGHTYMVRRREGVQAQLRDTEGTYIPRVFRGRIAQTPYIRRSRVYRNPMVFDVVQLDLAPREWTTMNNHDFLLAVENAQNELFLGLNEDAYLRGLLVERFELANVERREPEQNREHAMLMQLGRAETHEREKKHEDWLKRKLRAVQADDEEAQRVLDAEPVRRELPADMMHKIAGFLGPQAESQMRNVRMREERNEAQFEARELSGYVEQPVEQPPNRKRPRPDEELDPEPESDS